MFSIVRVFADTTSKQHAKYAEQHLRHQVGLPANCEEDLVINTMKMMKIQTEMFLVLLTQYILLILRSGTYPIGANVCSSSSKYSSAARITILTSRTTKISVIIIR